MPFTLSHPAAVVPLARRGWCLSALVVGSMAPDFQYFMHLSTDERYSHTVPGVFLFCVPTGLIVLWMFHRLLKFPLIALLPAYHQQRLLPIARGFRFGPPRQCLSIIACLIVGAFSHLLWDSFTHANSPIVKHYAFLQTPLMHLPHSSLRLYALLQYMSSVGGALALICWYCAWLREAPGEPLPERVQLAPHVKVRLLVGMAVCTTVLGITWGLHDTPAVAGLLWIRRFVRYSVIASITSIYVELVLFSLYWHFVKQRRSDRWM
ncbi:MAG: DUF4184 family protein [Abitibacteriaceae bacterium]|nr:DUF4184 family protein [Abditibacteriaceae bacterium]